MDSDSLADTSRVLAGGRTERRRLAENLERMGVDTDDDPEARVNAEMAELATIRGTSTWPTGLR
ncbi:MAG: hypothetical protein R3C49_04735 [Planctomycetaceae bacterium]